MDADFHSQFTVNDLRNDDEAVAQALLQSCRRGSPRRVIALCQLKEQLLFTLQSAQQPPQDLRFVHMLDPDLTALRAILQERWKGGYEPVGMVADRSEDGTLHAFLLVQKSEKAGLP